MPWLTTEDGSVSVMGLGFVLKYFFIWVCLRFDVGWLFGWVDLCLIVLLVLCGV